jgi:hypothetical protein
MPFLGQRPEGLGEELELLHGDRQLTRARPEQLAGHTDEVADVEVDEGGKGIAEGVGPRVELDAARHILKVREARLAVMADRHHAARQRHRARARQRVLRRVLEAALELPAPVGDRKPSTERVDAAGAPAFELVDPPADLLVGVGGERRIVGHP